MTHPLSSIKAFTAMQVKKVVTDASSTTSISAPIQSLNCSELAEFDRKSGCNAMDYIQCHELYALQLDYVQLDPWTIYNGRMICNGLLHASERKIRQG
jgi:hypothetical protein